MGVPSVVLGGAPQVSSRACWVALAGIVKVWLKGWPDGPGVLRAASINAEIFPPDRGRPVEGPNADPWLSTNSHAAQSVFVLA